MIAATARVAAPPGRVRAALPSWLAALVLFAASRLLTTALFVWVQSLATERSRAGAHPTLLDLATAWDGQWYWLIGVQGYPAVLPLTDAGQVDTNAWAFLPVYPLLSRALTLGVLDWRIPALAVSLVAGFVAAVLLAALLEPHIGRSKALFAVAVFACSPLAFVLQMAYAESLGLALLLGVLLLADRRRYLAAIPVALVLAFTRPGVLAVALAIGLLVILRVVGGRREGRAVAARETAAGGALAGICAVAGFAWSGIAALVTGRPDAYFATEAAWRALWMPERTISLFRPWLFAADFWAGLVVGPAKAWVAPLVLVLVVLGFAAILLLPPVRRLGLLVVLWLASYGLYLLAVFFPQSSVFRLLMPMAPLAGAMTPARPAARAAVLAVAVALQALWMWVVLGPVEDYWTIP